MTDPKSTDQHGIGEYPATLTDWETPVWLDPCPGRRSRSVRKVEAGRYLRQARMPQWDSPRVAVNDDTIWLFSWPNLWPHPSGTDCQSLPS